MLSLRAKEATSDSNFVDLCELRTMTKKIIHDGNVWRNFRSYSLHMPNDTVKREGKRKWRWTVTRNDPIQRCYTTLTRNDSIQFNPIKSIGNNQFNHQNFFEIEGLVTARSEQITAETKIVIKDPDFLGLHQLRLITTSIRSQISSKTLFSPPWISCFLRRRFRAPPSWISLEVQIPIIL